MRSAGPLKSWCGALDRQREVEDAAGILEIQMLRIDDIRRTG
jgi:hypothetical protein